MSRPKSLTSLVVFPNGLRSFAEAMEHRSYWDHINQAKVFFLTGLAPATHGRIDYSNTRRFSEHWKLNGDKIILSAKEWTNEFPSKSWETLNVRPHLNDALDANPMCLVKIGQILLLLESVLASAQNDQSDAIRALYDGVQIHPAIWTIPSLGQRKLAEADKSALAEKLFTGGLAKSREGANYLITHAEGNGCLSHAAAELITSSLGASLGNSTLAPVRRRSKGREDSRGNAVPASEHLNWPAN